MTSLVHRTESDGRDVAIIVGITQGILDTLSRGRVDGMYRIDGSHTARKGEGVYDTTFSRKLAFHYAGREVGTGTEPFGGLRIDVHAACESSELGTGDEALFVGVSERSVIVGLVVATAVSKGIICSTAIAIECLEPIEVIRRIDQRRSRGIQGAIRQYDLIGSHATVWIVATQQAKNIIIGAGSIDLTSGVRAAGETGIGTGC